MDIPQSGEDGPCSGIEKRSLQTKQVITGLRRPITESRVAGTHYDHPRVDASGKDLSGCQTSIVVIDGQDFFACCRHILGHLVLQVIEVPAHIELRATFRGDTQC